MASLAEQLKRINKNLNNSNVVKVLLEKEARRLYDILYEEIQNFYLSYSPVQYKRTYRFLNSLRIDPVTIEDGKLSIRIYFDDDMAIHPSIFGGEPGYVPILMNYGYQVRSNKVPNFYHLKWYEGYDFIGKALSRFKKSSPLNIEIQIHSEYKDHIIEDNLIFI